MYFPGFDRFTPILDRCILAFVRFIFASIPVTWPLQAKYTFVNTISFISAKYLISVRLKNIELKIFINTQNKYFPSKYSCHQSKTCPASLQCHRLSAVIHRQWQGAVKCSLQWRHNERDGVSNHRCVDRILHRLFRRISKKISIFRITGLCAGIHRWPGNSPHKGTVTRKILPFDDVIIL